MDENWDGNWVVRLVKSKVVHTVEKMAVKMVA
jgi:hypothetical protein